MGVTPRKVIAPKWEVTGVRDTVLV